MKLIGHYVKQRAVHPRVLVSREEDYFVIRLDPVVTVNQCIWNPIAWSMNSVVEFARMLAHVEDPE